MLENDIPGVCKRKGEILKAGLQSLAEKYPEIIQEVRGTGLMLAVEFHTCELGYETAKGLFARRVMTAGTLVNAKTIRFEPTAVFPSRISRTLSPEWMRLLPIQRKHLMYKRQRDFLLN